MRRDNKGVFVSTDDGEQSRKIGFDKDPFGKEAQAARIERRKEVTGMGGGERAEQPRLPAEVAGYGGGRPT